MQYAQKKDQSMLNSMHFILWRRWWCKRLCRRFSSFRIGMMLKLSELYEWDASDARTAGNDEFNWDSFRRDVEEDIKAFTEREWREGMKTKSSFEDTGNTHLQSQIRGRRWQMWHLQPSHRGLRACDNGMHRWTGMDTEIQKRLGLHEDSTSAIVERTKRILERWERSTKDHVPEAPRSKN